MTHQWHFNVDASRPTSAVTSIVKGEKKEEAVDSPYRKHARFYRLGLVSKCVRCFLLYNAWRLRGFFNIDYVGEGRFQCDV